ncbi:uncharacterized protein RHIMIDRAFT_261308 [Rhizopus microsporus ATCC 52813]|uniref:Uncharacterized protein n=1 Tax=Rhizopus microsporus ATCC 52813 TaxID=1340429 RepID=A0A2G4SME9_RHIZD|nr:uncharacterized protein RHIMIDRAFT_261308 [Rhizopus microsporus ATCC 52813]PHZ09930.1 hypothetical protein RHIMIDRAFT_261308 [Rhizopus microsporus ATCC 52813]
MSKRNIELLESLADEEQELYLNIRRSRIRKMNQELEKVSTTASVITAPINKCLFFKTEG